MKRYNVWDEVESLTGDMVYYTDHEAERNELYETINRNSKKIIKLKSIAEEYQESYVQIEQENKKLKEQNREMLEMLKSTYAVVKCNKIIEIDPAWLEEHKEIIEKVEGERMDKIEEARDILLGIQKCDFSDKTFDRYIIRYLAGDFAVEIVDAIKSRDEEVKQLLFIKKVGEESMEWAVKYNYSLISIVEEIIRLVDVDYLDPDFRDRAKKVLLGKGIDHKYRDEEIKKLRDALEEVGNLLYVDIDGTGDIMEARNIIEQALKDGE